LLVVSFGTSLLNLASAVVDVPITGQIITLDTPHNTTVTLTPSSSTLLFNPTSLVFDSQTSQVCLTITPLQAPLAQVAIVWTSSDPVNYVAPNPTTFGPIVQSMNILLFLVISFFHYFYTCRDV
jgi:hypothetical protein